MNDKTPTTDASAFDHVDFIIRFEAGGVTARELLEGFAHLISSGMAWSLQGSYGRTAQGLIESGMISREGVIIWERFDELENTPEPDPPGFGGEDS